MVDIKAALKKARSSGQSASPRGRAIVEVSSFNAAENTATGKIIDGLGVGETITFQLSGKLGVEDYVKKSKTKVALADGEAPGGTLQVEGLQKQDGKDVYKTRWVKTFRSKPDDKQVLHAGKTFALRVFERRDGGDVKRTANIDIIDVAGEAHVTDVAALRAAMVEAIDKTGAVTLMTVTPDGDPIIQPYYAKRVKQEDGTYLRQSGEARVAEFEERLAQSADTNLEEVFGPVMDKAGVSVIATTSLRIGTGTWDAVEEKIEEKGRGGPVDPESFRFATLAMRFAAGVRRMEVDADRKAVADAFLRTANEDAKAKFHEKGFAAVEDRDIRSFLEAYGAKMIEAPSDAVGFVSGSILTLPYNLETPENGEMVTKSFNVTAAAPFPPVKAFEDLRKAYYADGVEVAKAVAEAELGGKTQEKASETAPKAPAETAAPAADATPAVQDINPDDIDDLMMEIENEGIDP